MAGRPTKLGNALIRPEKPLTLIQIEAAIMLAEGMNPHQVSRKLKLSKNQVYRWMKQDQFTRQVQAQEAVRFIYDVPEAKETIMTLMRTAKSERIRLSAALAIVDRGGHKPVDRNINVNANIGSEGLEEEQVYEMAREALADQIQELKQEKPAQGEQKETLEAEYRVIDNARDADFGEEKNFDAQADRSGEQP